MRRKVKIGKYAFSTYHLTRYKAGETKENKEKPMNFLFDLKF
jgi:hypothetical protein